MEFINRGPGVLVDDTNRFRDQRKVAPKEYFVGRKKYLILSIAFIKQG